MQTWLALMDSRTLRPETKDVRLFAFLIMHVQSINSTTEGTQEEQNKIDDEKRKEAMRDLLSSWMDRLQLISVIVSQKSPQQHQRRLTKTNVDNVLCIYGSGDACYNNNEHAI